MNFKKATHWNDELGYFLANNRRVRHAWLDSMDDPTTLYIVRAISFNLYECDMSIPLASLRQVFYPRLPEITKRQTSPPEPGPRSKRATKKGPE